MKHNNIEELAADEEVRLQEENWERIQGILLLLGTGFTLWGWWRFGHDYLGSGASAVLLGLLCFAFRWNAGKAVRVTRVSFVLGLLAAVPLLALYFYSALPSFYWGYDPSFWLAVHAGAVVEPIWSPLAYMIGEATCYLFPDHVFSVLPMLSGFVISLVLFVTAQELLSQFKSKIRLHQLFVLFVCLALGLSRPLWTAATMASGLVSGLGLLLFLLQRHSLQLGKDHSVLSTLLMGLLWCVHPLWGLAGLLSFWAHEAVRNEMDKNWFAFLLGLSPYLWVFFRKGSMFPSWGGQKPFLEMLRSSFGLMLKHFATDWSWTNALGALGWEVAFLLLLTALLGLFNLLNGVEMSRKMVSPMDLWVWLLCGGGAVLFYSNSTDLLGATSLWFVAGMAGFFAFSFDRRAGLSNRLLSKANVGWLAFLGLLIAMGLTWLPGQRQVRDQYFFPQQHALNLIRPLGQRSLLICDSPFEYYGTLEAWWMEPSNRQGAVIDPNCLDQRWYLSQWIEKKPELLFSNSIGTPELLVKSLVLDNRDRWQIHWCRLGLPSGWTEPAAVPTGLTELFQDQTDLVDPASFQYRYDLSLIPIAHEGMDKRSRAYLKSYVEGFKALGQSLLAQGRYADAIHAFDRAARLDPADKGSMDQLSLIYSQHNLLEAAQLEYEKVLQTHPKAIDQLMRALDAAQEAKDSTKSADDLGQLVKLNSELADAQYQLSKIYEKQGRVQEAKALLESSVQINPKQVEAQMALGHAMEQSGDWGKAEEAFRSVITVDPQNKEAQVELWKLINKPKR